MAYQAKAVANEFLNLAKAEGKSLTPMKLLKLVYFAHGWYLAFSGQPLINERIEAWQYGPVIADLYHEFKRFGNDPIDCEANEIRFDSGKIEIYKPRIPATEKDLQAVAAKALIKRVWETYGKHSAGQLSTTTHQKGTPWDQVYRSGSKSQVIPDSLIQAYYENRIAETA